MDSRAWIAKMEKLEKEAKAHPGKAIRLCAGYYLLFTTKAGMVEIDHVEAKYDDTDWSGWVARAKNRQWHNDPVSTLAEAVSQVLAI